ncbi:MULTISPECIES: hypothetical protein [Comamonas]|uniref:hypothetical protein n=1 Tax=Comamonas TaxID=283 RepID=UPI0012D7AF52|nr:hypothetical protein [Comamonas testosteroni]
MSLDQNKPPKSSPNRSYIRVSTASRLMTGYYHLNGKNLRGSSVAGCGRWRAFGFDSTQAEIEVGPDGAKLHGHFRCGNVWTCDQCGHARVSQARSWIRAALIPALEAHGLGAAMMTFTMAHSYDGNWKDSIDLLHAAYKLFDKNMARRYKAIGCLGKLKSLEAPVGVHGIHGHFHVLLSHLRGADLTAFEGLARAEWEKAVAQVGGKCNDHGFDLKLNAMADYLAKQELSHEMSNHDTKKARKKGLLLGQLLDRAGRGDTKASAEWLRAIEALQGRSRFHAGDIAKKLGITTCTSWADEERQEEREALSADAPEPVRITYPMRDHLTATRTDSPRPGLAMILRAARDGDTAKVLQMVAALCAEARARDRLTPSDLPCSFWDWPDDFFERLLAEPLQT